MAQFATLDDYGARYGTPSDEKRVEALLEDASAALASAYEQWHGSPYSPHVHQMFDDSAAAVCCAMVSRVANVPTGMDGERQYTQTGGPYSESMTYSNPGGDMYLTKFDRERLGLAGMRIGSIQPNVDWGRAGQ